jgi:DNA primase
VNPSVETSSGEVLRAICPFCIAGGHMTRKKKLDYIVATGKWSCWRCKAWGRLTPQEALSASFQTPSRPGNGHVQRETVNPPEGFFAIGYYPSILSAPAHRYAVKRGITETAIAELGMGMTLHRANREEGEQDFRGRLIVPIFAPGSKDEWLGYVGRDYTGQKDLSYLYSKGLKRSRVLYREEILSEETDEPALAVEGTLDAAFLYPDGFAVLGTWGKEQMEMMRSAKRPIVALLDGDAWRKGEAMTMTLEVLGKKSGFIRLPPKKDPDQMDRQWLREEARRSIR